MEEPLWRERPHSAGLSFSYDKASIRVRINDSRTATLTVKSRGAQLKRLELEYPIPVIEAEAMLPLRQGAIVDKTRTRIRIGSHL